MTTHDLNAQGFIPSRSLPPRVLAGMILGRVVSRLNPEGRQHVDLAVKDLCVSASSTLKEVGCPLRGFIVTFRFTASCSSAFDLRASLVLRPAAWPSSMSGLAGPVPHRLGAIAEPGRSSRDRAVPGPISARRVLTICTAAASSSAV